MFDNRSYYRIHGSQLRRCDGMGCRPPGIELQQFRSAASETPVVSARVSRQSAMQGLDLRQAKYGPGAKAKMLAETLGSAAEVEQLLCLRSQKAPCAYACSCPCACERDGVERRSPGLRLQQFQPTAQESSSVLEGLCPRPPVPSLDLCEAQHDPRTESKVLVETCRAPGPDKQLLRVGREVGTRAGTWKSLFGYRC